jgi:hypothetical protein
MHPDVGYAPNTGRLGAARTEVLGRVHITIQSRRDLSSRYAASRTGSLVTGEVWQTAVATPGFVGLRPPNPLCTPIVASRVATAVLLNESSPAATAAA